MGGPEFVKKIEQKIDQKVDNFIEPEKLLENINKLDQKEFALAGKELEDTNSDFYKLFGPVVQKLVAQEWLESKQEISLNELKLLERYAHVQNRSDCDAYIISLKKKFLATMAAKVETTPEEQKEIKKCKEKGILSPWMEEYISMIVDWMKYFNAEWVDAKRTQLENMSFFSDNPELNNTYELFISLSNIWGEVAKDKLFDSHMDLYLKDKPVKDLTKLKKDDFSYKDQENVEIMNYQLWYDLDNVISGLQSMLAKLITVTYADKKLDFAVNNVTKQLSLMQKLQYIMEKVNEALQEKISLENLLDEMALPYIVWLPEEWIKVIKHDIKRDIEWVIKNNNHTYVNYTIKNGDATIYLTEYPEEWYKITGHYGKDNTHPIFWIHEEPLHKRLLDFYNSIGYKGDANKDILRMNEYDRRAKWTSYFSWDIYTNWETNPEQTLDVSPENICIIIYVLTGKIKIKKRDGFNYGDKVLDKDKIEELVIHSSDGTLSRLPPEIGQFKNLKTLNLSENKLTSLPPEIGDLRNLEELNISFNKISSLPYTIGELTSLKKFSAGDNQLTSLPPEIKNLFFVKNLDLRNNNLEELPPEIDNMISIERLHLGNNKLTSLPSITRDLRALQTIFLNNNQLTSLPSTFWKLENLKKLDLTNNHFEQRPSILADMNIPDLQDDFNTEKNPEELKDVYDTIRKSITLDHIPDIKERLNSGENAAQELSEQEIQKGEYIEQLATQNNPATTILAKTPWQQDLSSFAMALWNDMPATNETPDNPKLVESIIPPLNDNYRGSINDIIDNKMTKIEGTYKEAKLPEKKYAEKEIHVMTMWNLPVWMHYIPLPLWAKIIAMGKGWSWWKLEQDEKTGLYRFTAKVPIQGQTFSFVVDKETYYNKKEYVPKEFEKILPNIWPKLDEKLNAKQKVTQIRNRILSNSYYGFDTKFDKQLEKYKPNPLLYCQKLYEEWIKQYGGKMMMICNQSALFATLLLKKNGVPARIAVGIPWSDNLSWPWHAWTEYRDGNQRNTLDATPSGTPPLVIAQEMYKKQEEIKKSVVEKKIDDFDTLPIHIKNKIDINDPQELNFENIKITTNQLEKIIDILYLNKTNLFVKNIFLWKSWIEELPSNISKIENLETIDIKETNIVPAEAEKLVWLTKMSLISAPENRFDNKNIPAEIKNHLRREVTIIP